MVYGFPHNEFPLRHLQFAPIRRFFTSGGAFPQPICAEPASRKRSILRSGPLF
jgi:hypothetical protein